MSIDSMGNVQRGEPFAPKADWFRAVSDRLRQGLPAQAKAAPRSDDGSFVARNDTGSHLQPGNVVKITGAVAESDTMQVEFFTTQALVVEECDGAGQFAVVLDEAPDAGVVSISIGTKNTVRLDVSSEADSEGWQYVTAPDSGFSAVLHPTTGYRVFWRTAGTGAGRAVIGEWIEGAGVNPEQVVDIIRAVICEVLAELCLQKVILREGTETNPEIFGLECVECCAECDDCDGEAATTPAELLVKMAEFKAAVFTGDMEDPDDLWPDDFEIEYDEGNNSWLSEYADTGFFPANACEMGGPDYYYTSSTFASVVFNDTTKCWELLIDGTKFECPDDDIGAFTWQGCKGGDSPIGIYAVKCVEGNYPPTVPVQIEVVAKP